MNPDPVRLVSGCVSQFARGQSANIPEASVGHSMPVSGLAKPNTLRIISTFPNAVIQHPFMGVEVNVRIKIDMRIAYGSGFTA